MKKILGLLLVIFCLAGMNAHAQKPNCSKFYNGTFRMIYDGKVDTVIRAGTIQTELFNGTHKGTFAVKWIDECSYTLIPTDQTLTNNLGMPPKMVMTVTLSNTIKNTCTATITNNLTAEVIMMQMDKVK